ncbi:carbamoyltransferase HypF [Chitinibacter tainanensis]|uniref:carbamoyltransferase HypF n=1 Tax=Chitinibacter tainanensis TaxID=230667 RepID=UPI0023527066|nr:carbamoyltransferase HypF [Chitinibacter tainanensis]
MAGVAAGWLPTGAAAGLAMQQRLCVRGIVQGVGFRPYVYRLASELALSGWVRNDSDGVTIEIAGPAPQVAQFCQRLPLEAPAQARIDALLLQPAEAAISAPGFTIVASAAAHSAAKASIGPDTALCPACLAELFDPASRRYRYPLINCTDCGPRYTLVRRLPYDRANTSMAPFPPCPACAAEYQQPSHRRFHAEPNACPVCGPQLQLCDLAGTPLAGHGTVQDALAHTLALLQAGQIVAIKGLGGFHLVCDARNSAAVAELRRRKQRAAKPLAVMAANAASLAGWLQINPAEQQWLDSPARPIVLLAKLAGADEALPGIAPQLSSIGALLPYTPIQYLLFHEAAGRPAGLGWLDEPQDLLLVMTSANPRGEPLITDNQAALTQLAGLADAVLLHERDIVVRCDDSVLRVDTSGAAQFIRRARGYTPLALPLARATAPILALGGFYKNTLCLTRGAEAFVSQYIGELDRVANCRALEQASAHLQHLLQVAPQCVAHDLHPDFYSSQLAARLAAQWQVPSLAVQHHHAHIAAVLAEHQLDEPVLGLALDGVGLGDDGSAWGGELLLVDGAQAQRLGHLRPLALPGGDLAAREPWRMAAAVLHQLGRADEIASRFADQAAAPWLAQILRRAPAYTTSMGRYFDAAAGLLGLATQQDFEAQAAMLLEGAAARYGAVAAPAAGHELQRLPNQIWQLDLAPLLQQISVATSPALGAAQFHAGLCVALADWLEAAAAQTGLRTVAGGGGCFLNALLLSGLQAECRRRGLRLLINQAMPCGDGGLALGQAWVAQRWLGAAGQTDTHWRAECV